jgi:hypothetical protein
MTGDAALLSAVKRGAAVLRDAGIAHALGGSFAVYARGGPWPRSHDVDFALKESDLAAALEAFTEAGMHCELPPEGWLAKTYDGDTQIDLIHHPSGRAVDDAMLARAAEFEVESVTMPVLDGTDLTVLKLLSLSEHYCDFGIVLPLVRAVREQVDWDRVVKETDGSPFAEAALLLCARLGLVPEAR